MFGTTFDPIDIYSNSHEYYVIMTKIKSFGLAETTIIKYALINYVINY